MEKSSETRDRTIDRPAPLVTIGIPTFNRVDELQRSIASALAQSHQAIEVVVSDNASNDDTEPFVRDLAAGDPRVRYLRNSVNLGPSANFNRARGAANGDYFMWLANDDRIDFNYVACCLAALQSDPALALVAGVTRYYANNILEFEDVKICARSHDAATRVLEYYRQVVHNGTFYGLMPRHIIDTVSPLSNRVGSDWYHMAEVAFLGQIQTIEDTAITRSLDKNNSFVAIAQAGGYSSFQAYFPFVAIARSVALEVSIRSPVYPPLGWRRHVLALRATAVIFRRFVLTGLRWRSLKRRAGRLGQKVAGMRTKVLVKTPS